MKITEKLIKKALKQYIIHLTQQNNKTINHDALTLLTDDINTHIKIITMDAIIRAETDTITLETLTETYTTELPTETNE